MKWKIIFSQFNRPSRLNIATTDLALVGCRLFDDLYKKCSIWPMSFDAGEIPIEGFTVFEAGAGTGKTHTLTSIFLRLIAETDRRVGEILVVTFTEAATKELAARIRQRIQQACLDFESSNTEDDIVRKYLDFPVEQKQLILNKLERAKGELDNAAVFTIHGFCKRMLEDNAFESSLPFDSKLIKDESALLLEIVRDYYTLRVCDASPIFIRYLNSRKIWPKTLAALVKSVNLSIDTVIKPNRVETKGILERFLSAFEKAGTCWRGKGQEAQELLKNHGGLNKKSINREKLDDWFLELDEYFELENAAYPLSSNLSKAVGLTRSNLAAWTNKGFSPPEHQFFDALEELKEALDAFENLLVDFKIGLIEYCRSELAKRKKKQRLLSFDDLLSHTDKALVRGKGDFFRSAVRKQYKAVLIDEFQDTDKLQYRIFSKLFKDDAMTLFFIGDPKQSIYGFRGANVFAYLNAVADAKGSVNTLDTNWRSEPLLLSAINTIFSRAKSPFLSDRIEYRPLSPRPGAVDTLKDLSGSKIAAFNLRFIKRTDERLGKKGLLIPKGWIDVNLPTMAASDIACLLSGEVEIEGKALEPKDLAIIVRTNQQARTMREALAEAGVPAVLLGSESVFKSNEAAELWFLMDAMAAPKRRDKIKAALATQLIGYCANDIFELDQQDDLFAHIEEYFQNLHNTWVSSGFIHAMRSFLVFKTGTNKNSVGERLMTLDGGERRVTNLLHLTELLHAASMEQKLGPAGLLRWLDSKRDSSTGDSEEDQLRLETDETAVKIVTVHKAKGLEYKAVYCPYLWDCYLHSTKANEIVFHDPDNEFARTLTLNNKEKETHRDQAVLEEMSENLRLLYVALTRAKSLCVVIWGGLGGVDKSALGYLLHQSHDAVDPIGVSKRITGLSDVQILDDLDKLAKLAHPGVFAISELSPLSNKLIKNTETRFEDLVPRKSRLPLKVGLMTYSFTNLTKTSDEPDFYEYREHILDNENVSKKQELTFGNFDRGTRAGTCIHAIFEEIDFESKNREHIADTVKNKLKAHGFDPEDNTEPVLSGVLEVLRTRLCSNIKDLTLSAISKNKRHSELEFIFPIEPKNTEQITGLSLAEMMSRRPNNTILSEYSERLKKLDFSIAQGFLKGFIDLVFEWDGQYHLADFKSNYLGNSLCDYDEPSLRRAMTAGDYVLQYHLYATALHRYLGNRLQNYEYERHFGGVFYLFLRGMSPDSGPNSGVFFDLPNKTLIENMSDLFGRPLLKRNRG